MTDKLQIVKEALERNLLDLAQSSPRDLHDLTEQALEALNSYIAEDKARWLPISEAPRDGTIMLTWGDVPKSVRVAYYNPNVSEWDYYPFGSRWYRIDEPTYWQPLPTPPEGE